MHPSLRTAASAPYFPVAPCPSWEGQNWILFFVVPLLTDPDVLDIFFMAQLPVENVLTTQGIRVAKSSLSNAHERC